MAYVFNVLTGNLDYYEPASSSPPVSVDAYFPKYVLTNEELTIQAFGQYVLHGKVALILNGTAEIILEEGAEVILWVNQQKSY